MKLKITDIMDSDIRGVRVLHTWNCEPYKETYFNWTSFPMICSCKTGETALGVLQGWHHVPEFEEIEYHGDKELFYFVEGTALMLFVDIIDGKADLGSAQIVRIPEGTELEIEEGKGHFVPVAENSFYKAIVVSPPQDAPRVILEELVMGVRQYDSEDTKH